MTPAKTKKRNNRIQSKEDFFMKKQAKIYLILGILFLVLGILFLVTGAVSRTMAYGDFVLAIVFFGLSARAKKQSDDNKTDK